MLQWKLPDIRNVLASSPGKSKLAYRDRLSKSPIAKADETQAQDEVLIGNDSSENLKKVDVIKQGEDPIRMPTYAKHTTSALRS